MILLFQGCRVLYIDHHQFHVILQVLFKKSLDVDIGVRERIPDENYFLI
jgi:hypothetical protein